MTSRVAGLGPGCQGIIDSTAANYGSTPTMKEAGTRAIGVLRP